MLTAYFRSPASLEYYRSGIGGPYLDEFVSWLGGQGYHRVSIRRHVREVVHFADWAASEGLAIRNLDRQSLQRLRGHLGQSERYPSGGLRHIYQSARTFVRFLEAIGVVDVRAAPAATQVPAIVLEFTEWMHTQRGTLDSTLSSYRRPITDLLQSLSTEPRTYTAQGLREFILHQARHSSCERSKNLVTAIRMFLRFLVARGDCAAGLEYAVPTVARWRLCSLPKYLPAAEVERLIDSCDPASLLGARDRAIMLLIARLGLRAGEVSALTFGDLRWTDGILIVSGKNRRETRLPMPQDVGDAILHYLEHGRPHVASDSLFITVIAPFVPITRQVVGRAVVRAIRRTGINAPTQGAHLLRHSAATSLLRTGVSLPTIGALLRHASIETTTIYAKVDVDLLREVALPWPGVLPC